MGGLSNMKHEGYGKRIGKGLALAGSIALCLSLSGCYIPPDEITTGTENMVVGGNFDTMAPISKETQVPTQNPLVETTAPISQPTINWDDWGEETKTTVPSSAVGTSTIKPSTNTITVITQKPTDTPAPTALRNGSTGSEVRQVQQRLKTLGYLSGSADGDFGDATEAAVIAFQKANGLKVDGKVGTQTLAKLNSNNAVANTGSAITVKPNSSKATNTPKPTSTPNTENVYLVVGSSGKKVRTLQQRLIDLGYLAGTADGEYGGATQAAVKAFQQRSGLWADGIAGPDTLNKLYSSSAKKASTVASYVGNTLEEGHSGEAVRVLQRRLKALGYLTGTVDGDFGASTKAAVMAFQKGNGLKADGKAGSATMNKLFQEDLKKESDADSDKEVSSTGYVVLREGSEGAAVRKLQEALKKLGYYSGSVDGSYGSGTTSAVMAFQRMNDLKVDGAAGPATQRALYGTGSGSTVTYSTLREGDTGSAVKTMQYALYELGYYDGKIDSDYGATTKDAVRAFQIQNGITPVDGIAGNKTLQKLYSSSAKAASTPTSKYETLRPGATGLDVIEMQECLVQLGYLSEVTGVYDSATTTAVKNFQRNNGLNVDGTAGNDTLKKLYANNAK